MPTPRHILVVLALLAWCAAAFAAPGEVLRLPWAQWQYHATDDPACATSAPSCTWLPHPATNSWENDTRTYFWVRSEIRLDDQLAAAPSLALLIQHVEPVYEIYAGGRLIGGSGSFSTRQGPLDPRQIFTIPREAYSGGVLIVTVRLLNMHVVNRVAGMQPALGLLESVERQRDLDTFRFLRARWQHYLCYLLVCFVALFFFVLYSINRGAREYLWFPLLLLSISSLRFFEFASVINLGLPSAPALVAYTVLNVLAGIAFVEFPFAFVARRVPWYFRLVQVGTSTLAIMLLLLLPVSPAAISRIQFVESAIFINVEHWCLVLAMIAWIMVLPKCFRSPRPEMHWIGGSMAFLVFEEANRHLTLGHLPGLPQNLAIGSLDFDVRAFAYFLFAMVMLVAMTFRFRRIQERNRNVEQELAAAAAVQSLLLSSRSAAVGSFSIESVYHPAGEVGGDFFHVAPAGQGSLLVVVGDVSGKGLKAAMTVATTIGALRDFADNSPAAVLTHLNRVLFGQVSGFVTCCVAQLDPDGTLRLANAGHIPPYCNGVEIDSAPGLPLGILADQEWQETEIHLRPDARLVFVSDGVVEAAKISGELFGFDRTREISSRGAEAIAAAAQAFTDGAAQGDDITVVGIQYQPAAAAISH